MAKRKPTEPKSGSAEGFLFQKEEMMKTVGKALREMKFKSPDEANAFLGQFVGMRMEDVTKALSENRSRSVIDRADSLFFEAMEASTPAAMRRKLSRVLEIHPEHVRALTAVALMEPSPQAVEKGLRRAIVAGERDLGSLLTSGQGQLWGFLEARPYLEARAELARFFAGQAGRQDEAIAEHEELLRLNENDNQGIRDPLLGLLLETHRFDKARALVKRYQTDDASTWLYGKALLEFQQRAEEAKWDTSRHDSDWLEQQMKGA